MPTERARPFAVTLLLGAAAFTIALAGVRSINDIIGPAFLALVITITLHPIRMWLERHHRLPSWAASILMLLAAYLLLFLLTLALTVSVAQLAELLPEYTDQLKDVVSDAGNTLEESRRRAGPDRCSRRTRSTRVRSSTSRCRCCPARWAS